MADYHRASVPNQQSLGGVCHQTVCGLQTCDVIQKNGGYSNYRWSQQPRQPGSDGPGSTSPLNSRHDQQIQTPMTNTKMTAMSKRADLQIKLIIYKCVCWSVKSSKHQEGVHKKAQ